MIVVPGQEILLGRRRRRRVIEICLDEIRQCIGKLFGDGRIVEVFYRIEVFLKSRQLNFQYLPCFAQCGSGIRRFTPGRYPGISFWGTERNVKLFFRGAACVRQGMDRVFCRANQVVPTAYKMGEIGVEVTAAVPTPFPQDVFEGVYRFAESFVDPRNNLHLELGELALPAGQFAEERFFQAVGGIFDLQIIAHANDGLIPGSRKDNAYAAELTGFIVGLDRYLRQIDRNGLTRLECRDIRWSARRGDRWKSEQRQQKKAAKGGK